MNGPEDKPHPLSYADHTIQPAEAVRAKLVLLRLALWTKALVAVIAIGLGVVVATLASIDYSGRSWLMVLTLGITGITFLLSADQVRQEYRRVLMSVREGGRAEED